jgi:hypothetical protein
LQGGADWGKISNRQHCGLHYCVARFNFPVTNAVLRSLSLLAGLRRRRCAGRPALPQSAAAVGRTAGGQPHRRRVRRAAGRRAAGRRAAGPAPALAHARCPKRPLARRRDARRPHRPVVGTRCGGVTRDQTSRDRADLQQPFNLQVPRGVKNGVEDDVWRQGLRYRAFPVVSGRAGARVSRTSRAPPARPAAARRRIGQSGQSARPGRRRQDRRRWLHRGVRAGVAGADLADDRRDAGTPVVRERNWIAFQAGEVRVCASCHGTNTANQTGLAAPVNKPPALRELLNYWKTLPR